MAIAEKHIPHYTYEDYCQWEGKWELIEGMPYAMSPAPIPQHQRVSLKLGMLLENSLSTNCKKCKVYMPIDWKISEETKTMQDMVLQKAECDFRGRHYIAWFNPKIPIPDGPWKLRGLPGLILEATMRKNTFNSILHH